MSGSRRRELAGDAGQPGAERERLDLLASGDGGVDEPQQRPRVRLHRSADVEQEHEPAVAGGRVRASGAGSARRPTSSPPAPCGAGRVVPCAPCCAARRRDSRGEPTSRRRDISCCASISSCVGVVGEVLVPQHLGGAEAQLDRLVVGRLGGVGFVVRVVAVSSSTASVMCIGSSAGAVLARRLATLPEHLERPVVDLVVLGAAHERRPAGPVRVVAVVDPGRDERFGEGDRRAHRDGAGRRRAAAT